VAAPPQAATKMSTTKRVANKKKRLVICFSSSENLVKPKVKLSCFELGNIFIDEHLLY
jgi:hypothetical protein